MRNKLPYKLPTIVRAKGDWFVRYSYELPDRPGKFKEFRVRDGVNFYDNIEEKEKAIAELQKDIKYALEKMDFNPFLQSEGVKGQIKSAKALIEANKKIMTIAAAVSWIILTKKSKNKSDKYLREYIWIRNYFAPWCNERSLFLVSEPKIDDIELFLSEMLENEEWSARTYNNKIAILTSFYNYLVSKRKLTDNPIKPGMLEKISNTAEKNKYYEQKTLQLILPKVAEKPELRRMIRWTYYTCARGTELRGLKIKNIDLDIKKIVITAETGKTGEIVGKRNIPICQELYDIIIEEKLMDLPADWFVFGDKGRPGPKKLYHGYFSDQYFEIKKELGLDFKYTIYSFKHTRVCDLLSAEFDPVKVMLITGHTDWRSFQAYTRELGAVMQKQLIGNTLKLNL